MTATNKHLVSSAYIRRKAVIPINRILVDRPLRLLVLSSCTSHKGGLEVMCLQVAREMKERGHEIVLVYRDKGDAFSFYEEIVSDAYQVDLRPFGLRDPFSSARLVRQLIDVVNAEHIDLCFSTDV